jgi:uncharacterized protein (TIGR00725 family)
MNSQSSIGHATPSAGCSGGGERRGGLARDPFTGGQIRIGVMGSAGGDLEASHLDLCRRLGQAVARRGCCLLTGACPGLPHAAVLGAREAGGHVIGISPAMNLKEHVEVHDSPYAEYDVLIFTGLGLVGRKLVNIRTSDIVIVVGGRSGTLGEFAIAYEEGKLIGALLGTGGITDVLPAVERTLRKGTGAQIIYERDPAVLVDRLLERYLSGAYICPCHPEDLQAARAQAAVEGGNVRTCRAPDARRRRRDEPPAPERQNNVQGRAQRSVGNVTVCPRVP